MHACAVEIYSLTPHPCRQKIFDGKDLVLYELLWILSFLCKWKSPITDLQAYIGLYTLQRCVITMGKLETLSKN